MSFATVFTVGATAFVLVVPALMVLVLSAVSPSRRAVADGPADGARPGATDPAASLSRAS